MPWVFKPVNTQGSHNQYSNWSCESHLNEKLCKAATMDMILQGLNSYIKKYEILPFFCFDEEMIYTFVPSKQEAATKPNIVHSRLILPIVERNKVRKQQNKYVGKIKAR